MSSILLDIEVFKNFFFVGFKDLRTGEKFSFEISDDKDQRDEFFSFFSKYSGYLVSFNGVHYDEVVIFAMLKEWKKLRDLPLSELVLAIKDISDSVINQENNWETVKWWVWGKKNWVSVDLFTYWSKMIRLSKKISLKGLAFQLRWDEIQELPYHHTSLLDSRQREEVRRYNMRNDLGITELLMNKMSGDVKLRKSVEDMFGLKCWSKDAAKIAGELMVKDYCEKTYPYEFPNLSQYDDEWFPGYETFDEYSRNVKNKRFNPYYGLVRDIMGDFKVDFELPFFKKLKNDMYNNTRDWFSETKALSNLPLIHDDSGTRIRMSYGIGGVHSINSNEYYKSNETHIIVTSDYASLYPNIIINWLCIRYPEVLAKYKSVMIERLKSKKLGDKKTDSVLKLILNSLSGLLDMTMSPLYFPEGALRMRIAGQLILSKTMEVAMINGWRVISANTDGIEVIIPRSDWDKYQSEMDKVSKYFAIDIEHDQYEFIAYSNVNNYIAKTVRGKAKRKGSSFRLYDETPLGDSTNHMIIPIALSKYFLEGVPIEKTIKEPWRFSEISILDYCVCKKVASKYNVVHNQEVQQNVNRYYFSKNGPFLFKQLKGSTSLHHLHTETGVRILNSYKEGVSWEDYDINYDYYVSMARKIVDDITVSLRAPSLFD